MTNRSYNPDNQLGEEFSRQEVLTIGAITAVLVSLAKRRTSFYLRNTSTGGQIISLSMSNKDLATAGNGVVLNPNDTYAESNGEGFICWNGKITAISNLAGATLSIIERD